MTRYILIALAAFVCSSFVSAAAPSHKEVGQIAKSAKTKFNGIKAIAVSPDGNLLAAVSNQKAIVIISPDDKLLGKWTLDFAPTALCAMPDGSVYVAGGGAAAKLSKEGKVEKSMLAKNLTFPDAKLAQGPASVPASAVAVDGKDIYVAYPYTGGATRGIIIRFDQDFASPKIIVTGMRGCCGNLDIAARDGKLYVAENAGHRVITFDRDGKQLAVFGAYDRAALSGFGGCCNPMNICFGSDGAVYTSEKTPNRVKRYDTAGKMLSLVSYVGGPEPKSDDEPVACVSSQVAVNKDGSRIFVLDTLSSTVRVLEQK